MAATCASPAHFARARRAKDAQAQALQMAE